MLILVMSLYGCKTSNLFVGTLVPVCPIDGSLVAWGDNPSRHIRSLIRIKMILLHPLVMCQKFSH